MRESLKRKQEVQKLAEKLKKEWIELHNDWRTPVWGSFRDKAERLLDNANPQA